MELMYGDAVKDEEELRQCLENRNRKIVVVRAANAAEFVPYGRVVLDVADRIRKPLFVVIDEGQLSVRRASARRASAKRRTSSTNSSAEAASEHLTCTSRLCATPAACTG